MCTDWHRGLLIEKSGWLARQGGQVVRRCQTAFYLFGIPICRQVFVICCLSFVVCRPHAVDGAENINIHEEPGFYALIILT